MMITNYLDIQSDYLLTGLLQILVSDVILSVMFANVCQVNSMVLLEVVYTLFYLLLFY